MREYFPAAVAAFDDLDAPDTLELLGKAPDPAWAARTGLDPTAIWEWGVVERVSTGLLLTQIGVQPVGGQMLAAADRIAQDHPG